MTLSAEDFILTGRDEAEEVTSFRLRYGIGNKVKAISEDLSEVKRLIQSGLGIGFCLWATRSPRQTSRLCGPCSPILSIFLAITYGW